MVTIVVIEVDKTVELDENELTEFVDEIVLVIVVV